MKPKTKIIATLGPASDEAKTLRRMIEAGLDVVRLNFSHADQAECRRLIRTIRALNKKYHRRILILGDLEGPRIRIGGLKQPILLKKNQVYWLTNVKTGQIFGGTAGKNAKKTFGRERLIPFDYPGRLKDIAKGLHVYIDDGNLALKVEGHKNGYLITRVVTGGLLKEHKGVNIPGTRLKFTSPTTSDRKNIEFCLRDKIDWIAQSFVRSKEDILKIKKLLNDHRSERGSSTKSPSRCRLIAKIENGEGVKNLDGIIESCDGIMVARGDLGVSLPIWEVPMIQKEIIRKCKKAGKISITATQMLESMKENLRPERAEVSDVANAILDGSNYLMLSAETSVGRYPVESVRMMNEVIKFTEKYQKNVRPGC